MRFHKLFYVVVSLLLFSVNGVADDITLDFESLKNMEQVQDFYNGGAGSEGSTKGLDYSITFSDNTLALIDSDAGGDGNFANEPSPDTAFFFTGSDTNIYMNVEGGFTEGFSFYYTSIHEEGDVEVWTEPNGQGKKIGSLHLEVTPQLGKGDPYGEWDNWAKKSLSFDGRAKSVVFKGVANQIGFDNITLSPNAGEVMSNNAMIAGFPDTVYSPAISNINNIANSFRVKLELKTDNKTSFEDLKKLCEKSNSRPKYYFSIVEKNNRSKNKTKQIGCEVKKDKTSKKNILQLDFSLLKENGGYFLENGTLEIDDRETKMYYDIFKNFNIYGTDFDMKKDAFSFANGDFVNPVIDKRDNQLKFNVLGALVESIDRYIIKKEALYKDIGVDIKRDWGHGGSFNYDSAGLCHGMTHVVVANFIHKNDNAWNLKLTEEESTHADIVYNKSINNINEYWNVKKLEINKNNPKPLDTNNVYKISTVPPFLNAMQKILFYHISQDFYKTDGNSWAGKEKENLISDDDKLTHSSYIDKVRTHFIQNEPVPFSFRLGGNLFGFGSSGHSILNTQIIEYDDNIILYFYDSNKLDKFTNFIFKNGKVSSSYGYKKVRKFKYTSNDDPLHVYKVNKSNNTQKITQKKLEKLKDKKAELDYFATNYMKIYTVGGSFKKVSLKSDDSAIKLYPISATLEKDKAYKNEANIFNNTLLLPVDKQYKVTVKKEAGFITLKLFVTIPKADGTAEYLVYDHAETSKEDATMVTFTVGRDNTDKSLKREGASDYAPDTEKVYKLKLASATSINAIVLENEVKLSWQNPVHPNYEESVVVRKEDSVPTSITDGTEVYRGTDEEFLDTTVANEKKYYYAVYAVSKDNEPTEPVWTDVDTYRYTLYGTLSDAGDEPISGATVTLYNGTKTRLIDTSFSSQNGLFTFNNLLDGEYVLNFSHPSYTFEKSELNVTVEKKSKEVLLKAEGVANLFMDIPQAVKVGEIQTIIWDGVHIDDSAIVNIKLFRDEKWETLASNVAYNKHAYKWSVTAPKGEAKIRIELDNATFVESDVFIFGADELKYDFDGDGDIDVDDIMTVVKGWNSKIGDADYNSAYDYNGDGVIDIKDIMKIASMWGML